VSPAGLQLRQQVSLVEGRLFRPGLREVICSRLLARRFAILVGQPLRLDGGPPWEGVGLFDGQGGAFDSEIWADVNAVSSEFKRPIFSSVLLRATDAGAVEKLKERIANDQRLQLSAFSEVEYFKEQTRSSMPIRILGQFIAFIMSVGAA